MKIVENESMSRPFWQDFFFELCKTIGIDPKKQAVADLEIKLRPGRLPRIVVTIEPYNEREIKPIVEVFQAVEWKNTRE